LRRFTIAAAGIFALALACGWWLASGPDAALPARAPSAAVSPELDSRNPAQGRRAGRDGLRAQGFAAPLTATELAALQDRDQRRRAAMAQFQAGLLVGLDRCLPAGPGPRTPQRLVLHFERAQPGDAGHERFQLVAVDPVDAAPNQPSPRQSPAWACFAGLAGRTVDVAIGAASQESSFQEVVAIPLPTSVGWAATAPRPLRMP
jgi:hypothetical protein